MTTSEAYEGPPQDDSEGFDSSRAEHFLPVLDLQDSGILTSIELITPQLAAQYLSKQDQNRKAFDHRVQLYARQMRRGEWKLSPQGISFDEKDRLLDGQHRLRAVIEARRSVPFFVFRRVPKDVQMVFDQGLPRTAGQAAQILGLNLKPREMAIGSAMLMRIPPVNVEEIRTLKERIDFCLAYQDAIRFAAKVSRYAGSQPCEHASVRAIVARAYYSHSKERLAQFLYCLDTGFISDEADSAAVALRNVWLGRKSTSGYTFRQDLYTKTAAALLAFLEGRPLRLVRPLTYQPFGVEGLSD
ncbi:MAG: hypothetical protein H7Y22_06615 [Gemmatimonadaceae bacterium]|nr:hypothetical protein [Gloeobacterales cyanobacterium ES-bin-141]